MSMISGFMKGLQAADVENKRQQIEAEQKAWVEYKEAKKYQPKGVLTGNTVDEIAAGVVMPDSPIYPESVKLAGAIKESGYSRFKQKVMDVESSGGDYKAKNKSGAYGAYQFMPSTAKWVAKELGIDEKNWKEPENQDKMFDWLTEHNKKGLKRAGIPATEETLWWAHNQGLGGAKALYNDGNVSTKNISANGGNTKDEYKKKWASTFSDALVSGI